MPAARKPEPGGRDIYAPKEPFVANIDGQDISFTPQTLVREGHRILDLHPNLFEPVRVAFDVEQATAKPGEKRAR